VNFITAELEPTAPLRISEQLTSVLVNRPDPLHADTYVGTRQARLHAPVRHEVRGRWVAGAESCAGHPTE
jgi:hypothetical protein